MKTQQPEVKFGVIAGLSGHPMSGLWTLHFEDGSSAYIESGFGVRQLVSAFGGVRNIKAQAVEYTVDDLGLLAGFTPMVDA